MNRTYPWIMWALTSAFLSSSFGQIDPGRREDVASERQRILKAADQMDILLHKVEKMELELASLKTTQSRLEEENKALKSELDMLKAASVRERDALLKEVARIVAEKPTSSVAANTATPAEGYEHIVKSGQSLWAIANSFQKQGVSVTVEDIRRANQLKEGDPLKVGQKLFIPHK
ncbi:MAG: LysM peptidoglycan-binding domain-containing protein [Candidatus Methylacidiphilales bacterium]